VDKAILIDLMNQVPATADTFSELKGRILLILSDKDFFPEALQKNLIALMHEPEIKYISGGHLSTVCQSEEYLQEIRMFLSEQVPDNV